MTGDVQDTQATTHAHLLPVFLYRPGTGSHEGLCKAGSCAAQGITQPCSCPTPLRSPKAGYDGAHVVQC